MKKYILYYYSKLGTQRKPSVTNLLLEQKDKIIYDFRKKRARSRRDCNCFYFSDLDKYCVIMATLVNNSDISLGAVILDDEALTNMLNLNPPSEVPNINFHENYSKTIFPSLAEQGQNLDEINKVRLALSQTESWSYIQPMTQEQFEAPFIVEEVTLPIAKN